MTSACCATSERAPSCDLLGSNQEFSQTTFTVTFGLVFCAPST